METQLDHKVRVVALGNLEAMCAHVSGTMCHQYAVSKVSRSRVHVEYSNEDEYGTLHPMTAVFPCYPSGWQGDEGNPRVVLDMLRVLNDDQDEEGWQSFQPLLDCPALYRGCDAFGKAIWQTEGEIMLARKHATTKVEWDKHGCQILGWRVTLSDGRETVVAPNDEALLAYLKTLE